jgi:hypothetical protein
MRVSCFFTSPSPLVLGPERFAPGTSDSMAAASQMPVNALSKCGQQNGQKRNQFVNNLFWSCYRRELLARSSDLPDLAFNLMAQTKNVRVSVNKCSGTVNNSSAAPVLW